jgi:type IV pilus assembly protein PilV
MVHTRRIHRLRVAQNGAALLEALIAILIFSIGILAAVGMQAAAIKSVTDSKYRTQASFFANTLIAKMWTDAVNVGSYAYPGSGPVPAKVQPWVNDVTTGTSRMPLAVTYPPIVTVANATAQGGTVTVQVRWQLPEEKSKNLPPHNYTAVAAIYSN